MIQTKLGVFPTLVASNRILSLADADDPVLSPILSGFPNRQTRHQPPYLLKLPYITGTTRIMVLLSDLQQQEQ